MTLTDRNFWLNYWENKKDLLFVIPKNFILSDFLVKITQDKTIKTALEMGGFPGHYSIYLKKYLNVNPTILDYVIHPKILNDLIDLNGLKHSDIGIIEGDAFNIIPKEKFDLVFSNGLVEHFDDVKKIIEIHVNFMADKGVLFISLPNFRGLNGWFQRNFDMENYKKHNISTMDIDLLKKVSQELNLTQIECYYNGKFMIWLENIQTKNEFFKTFFWLTKTLFKIVFKILPFESKAFSPYIILTAKKP